MAHKVSELASAICQELADARVPDWQAVKPSSRSDH
jgi:hypothetical protein